MNYLIRSGVVVAHVALALVCGLPVVGFFAATAPWWRGEA